MSGTSLDGLDMAFIKFQSKPIWTYEFLCFETLEYTAEWKDKLRFRAEIRKEKLEVLDREYGEFLDSSIKNFILKNKIDKLQVDLISSHGHTLFHKPDLGITHQIGNGPELFLGRAIPVVCDFRVQDVELGGQGAPLVPIGDRILFNEFDSCINLGGFANISFEKNKSRLAMDICPLNFVCNELVKPIGLNYDHNGEIARQGHVNKNMLERMNGQKYYSQSGPKTLGAEWVRAQINPILAEFDLEIKDALRTFTEHASDQIARILNVNQSKKALFTGGGVYNGFLMERIIDKSNGEIIVPSKDLIEFKEALIFGLLGILRLQGKVNVLASVTGASKDHCSGRIYI